MLGSTNPAARLFNEAWDEFEAGHYDAAVEKAEHSLEIWTEIGTERNICIGNWQVGRFKCFAGDFVGARHSYSACREELAKVEDPQDWMLASIAELGARVVSNEPGSELYLERYLAAEELIALISEHEEQVLIAGQFADLPRPE